VAVAYHFRRTRLNYAEAFGRITLAKYCLSGGHMDRFQAPSQLFDSRQWQRLQHRHPVKQPDLLVQSPI